MTAATSFGFESIGTWLVFNSVVVAFMRFAKKRSSSGAIAPSSLDTMYHDGFVFHAKIALGTSIVAAFDNQFAL
jgi:hypothetical protein